MAIIVKSAKVLIQAHGPDLVIVETNLPPAIYPFTENTSPRFEVARGQGAQYVRNNLSIEPEIIEIGA
jgi:hypothetical protein